MKLTLLLLPNILFASRYRKNLERFSANRPFDSQAMSSQWPSLNLQKNPSF